MRHRSVIPVALACAAMLSAAAPPILAKGPGDPEAPITLRLLVQDAPGRQSEAAALDLQRLADELTDGIIRIEPSFGGGIDVLGPVADGEYELGMVPSRDAGDHGVTSLDVLEAPFLIDNDALALAVATSDIADRAMAGLGAIGVTGLAMWPEDLRHLFAMDPSGRSFVLPGDVADADVLVVAGPVGRELIPTLGGRLYADDGVPSGDMVGSKDPDAQAGTLEGFVTGLWGAGLPLTSATVAGDLVVFSKYQMLVANPDMLARLTESQRALLDTVVQAAHAAALERHFTERELALSLCQAGHTVVEAGAEAITAWRAAAQPLTERLAADPLTGELMADVGYLAADTAPSPGAGTCAPPDASAVRYPVSDTTGTFGTLPPDGRYRAQVEVDDLVARGADPDWAVSNAGVMTWTYADGRVSTQVDGSDEVCQGRAVSRDGAYVSLITDPGQPCSLELSYMWRPAADGLEFVLVAPEEPWEQQDFRNIQAHIEGRTWLRIDGPMPSVVAPATFIGDRLPPPGTYRAILTVDDLVAAGASRDFAGRNAGTWDWTFTPDAWSAAHGNERCGAPMRVADGYVELVLNSYSEPCTMAYDLRWREEGGGLRFEVVDINWAQATPEILADERAMTERVWVRVQ